MDENVRKDWVKWVDDLSAVKFITLPRCYCKGQIEILNSTLHVFTNASVLAFAAVIYLVIQTQSEYFSSLVTSKTRVAPLTDISLPRLELLGALTGARLINCVHEALTDVLRVNEIVCWSDSLVTLYWIKGINKHFKQFVENRTLEIRKNTEIQFWRHCPGTLNPADIPTRGMSATEFVNNDLWFKGLDFIRKPKEFWPEDISADIKEPLSDALVEERTVINLIAETKMCLRVSLEQIIDLQRYSSYEKLLRVTLYVIRFASKLYAKVTKSQLGFPETLAVETEEVANAEKLWIQSVQSVYFEGSKYGQLKTQLGVFLTEENILRCKGRLKHSSLPYSKKFPASPPSDSRLTELIILQCHSRVFHNETLEDLK